MATTADVMLFLLLEIVGMMQDIQNLGQGELQFIIRHRIIGFLRTSIFTTKKAIGFVYKVNSFQ